MPFEFDLVPLNSPPCFAADVRAEMRAWWARFPTTTAADGTLLVFPDEDIRAIRLARQRFAPHANDYLTSMVSFEVDRVILSVTGDSTTPWFYDFAIECGRRWNCELRYVGRPAAFEDILASSGG